MFTKRLTAAALAAALIAVPTTRATADTKDIIVGAIVGGAVIAGISAAQKRKKQQEAIQQQQRAQAIQPRVSSRSHAPKARRTVRAAPKVYKPSIPATQQGREIQSALNYFGFNAGAVDGRVGGKTKQAVAGYQAYLGYPATGTLSAFEQHVLTQTYLRAEAGGADTFRTIAQLPEGPRGLLKLYRQELAGVPSTPQIVPSAAYDPTLLNL